MTVRTVIQVDGLSTATDSGATSTGKTTLLNALAAFLPPKQRGVDADRMLRL